MPSLLSIIPLQLFFTVWAGGFCGGFVAFPLGLIPMIQAPPGTEMAAEYFLTCLAPVAFFAVPAFFGVPIVAYWSKKRRYAKPEYRFFPTSLEYYEGFFTVEQKTIDYRVITEVTVRKGPIQRMYGLGDLFLSTPATGTVAGASRSGAVLSDIEHPDELYQQVRGLIQGRAAVQSLLVPGR